MAQIIRTKNPLYLRKHQSRKNIISIDRTVSFKKELVSLMTLNAILFGLGDFFVQFFLKKETEVKLFRIFKLFFYGGLISAPIGFYWHKFLDRKTFRIQTHTEEQEGLFYRFIDIYNQKFVQILLKIIIDQFFFTPFVSIPSYYITISILDFPKTWSQYVFSLLSYNWWQTLKLNWLIWPLTHMFSFYFVPIKMRIVFLSFIGFLWNLYLSMITG